MIRRRWPWRDFLDAHERIALDAIDARAMKLDKERRELTAERNLLVNRAIQRAKYRPQGKPRGEERGYDEAYRAMIDAALKEPSP